MGQWNVPKRINPAIPLAVAGLLLMALAFWFLGMLVCGDWTFGRY
jgi:hypothetical protein